MRPLGLGRGDVPRRRAPADAVGERLDGLEEARRRHAPGGGGVAAKKVSLGASPPHFPRRLVRHAIRSSPSRRRSRSRTGGPGPSGPSDPKTPRATTHGRGQGIDDQPAGRHRRRTPAHHRPAERAHHDGRIQPPTTRSGRPGRTPGPGRSGPPGAGGSSPSPITRHRAGRIRSHGLRARRGRRERGVPRHRSSIRVRPTTAWAVAPPVRGPWRGCRRRAAATPSRGAFAASPWPRRTA